MADPGPLKRPLYPPDHPDGPSPGGGDVIAIKRAISRAGFWLWQKFDNAYSNAFAQGGSDGDGVAGFQRKNGIQGTGNYGSATHNALRDYVIPKGLPHAGEKAFDQTAANQYLGYDPPSSGGDVPNLGPIYSGSKSVLDQDLTHATGGLDLYPAFDDAFGEGRTIIAPENIEITKASSSNPGDACYALGDSGIQYWFGHLTTAPSVGVRISKGGKVGVTCVNNIGGGPHCHLGINVENLWGKGKQLQHHTDYTHGAPTVGDQLASHSS